MIEDPISLQTQTSPSFSEIKQEPQSKETTSALRILNREVDQTIEKMPMESANRQFTKALPSIAQKSEAQGTKIGKHRYQPPLSKGGRLIFEQEVAKAMRVPETESETSKIEYAATGLLYLPTATSTFFSVFQECSDVIATAAKAVSSVLNFAVPLGALLNSIKTLVSSANIESQDRKNLEKLQKAESPPYKEMLEKRKQMFESKMKEFEEIYAPLIDPQTDLTFDEILKKGDSLKLRFDYKILQALKENEKVSAKDYKSLMSKTKEAFETKNADLLREVLSFPAVKDEFFRIYFGQRQGLAKMGMKVLKVLTERKQALITFFSDWNVKKAAISSIVAAVTLVVTIAAKISIIAIPAIVLSATGWGAIAIGVALLAIGIYYLRKKNPNLTREIYHAVHLRIWTNKVIMLFSKLQKKIGAYREKDLNKIEKSIEYRKGKIWQLETRLTEAYVKDLMHELTKECRNSGLEAPKLLAIRQQHKEEPHFLEVGKQLAHALISDPSLLDDNDKHYLQELLGISIDKIPEGANKEALEWEVFNHLLKIFGMSDDEFRAISERAAQL